MLLTRKSAGERVSHGMLSRSFGSAPAMATLDRRAFLKRSGLGLGAGAVLLLGTLLAAIWWLPDWQLPDDLYGPVLAATLLVGAGLVALVMAFWRPVPRPRRFDQRVREQLASGAWALVVHDVPAERQAGVVALLRGSSLKWCGEAAPAQRL